MREEIKEVVSDKNLSKKGVVREMKNSKENDIRRRLSALKSSDIIDFDSKGRLYIKDDDYEPGTELAEKIVEELEMSN